MASSGPMKATGFTSRGRAGGNAGRGGPGRGQGTKRGPQGHLDHGNKKAQKLDPEAMKAQKALHELKTWTHNAFSNPRGRDSPLGNVSSKMNAPKKCLLAIRAGVEETIVYSDCKFQFNLMSQTPELVLLKDKWEIRIRGTNVLISTTGEIVEQFESKFDELEKIHTQPLFSSRGYTLKDDDAAHIEKFGTVPTKPEDGGLHYLTMRLGGELHAKWTQEGDSIESTWVKAVVNTCNRPGPPVFTLIRRKNQVVKELDDYWMAKMKIVAQHGIYPFFSHKDQKLGDLLSGYSGPKHDTLPFMRWMEKPDRRNKLKHKRQVSFPAKHTFGEMRELEIVQKAALLHEVRYTDFCSQLHFSYGVTHRARVIKRLGKKVELVVSVTTDDEIACPTLDEFTKFKMRIVESNLEEKMAKEQEAEKEKIEESKKTEKKDGDSEMSDEKKVGPLDEKSGQSDIQKALDEIVAEGKKPESKDEKNAEKQNIEYQCKVVLNDTTTDLVIGFEYFGRDNKAFKRGMVMEIELQIQINHKSTDRMFKAVGDIARLAGTTEPYQMVLKDYLLGRGMTDCNNLESPKDQGFRFLTPSQQVTFENVKTINNMNKHQLEARNGAIESKKPVNLIQGPPGTGKTNLVSFIGTDFAMLGFRTVMCAPTNKACEAIMKHVTTQVDALHAIDKSFDIGVVYFPTLSKLNEELSEATALLNQMREMVNEDDEAVAEAPAYEKYMAWHHVVNHFQNPSAKDTPEGKDWLETLENLRHGETVGGEALRTFKSATKKVISKILKHQNCKIIVSTFNNCAQLKKFGVTANAVICDEAAFANEQDIYIPLTLGAQQIVLAGDHKQLQPYVESVGFSNFSEQQGTSLFQRTVGHPGVPVFRLKENYRMHESIALFPAMVAYGWLKSNNATNTRTDTVKHIESWWASGDSAEYRKSRRQPEYNDDNKVPEAERGFRRMLINVQGGRSAKVLSGTSMVNYANIPPIMNLLASVLEHQPAASAGLVNPMEPEDICIITGYVEQRDLIARFVHRTMGSAGWETFPRVVTIDSIQGGQSKIVILDITVANQFHGSLMGFMKRWNRMNVALTRSEQMLWMVGNLDCWRSELKVLVESFRAKTVAYFIMDLVYHGDIIDVEGVNALPKTDDEFALPPEQWTEELHEEKNLELPKKVRSKAAGYRSSKSARDEYEKGLIASLIKMRTHAIKCQLAYDNGEDVEHRLLNQHEADTEKAHRGRQDGPNVMPAEDDDDDDEQDEKDEETSSNLPDVPAPFPSPPPPVKPTPASSYGRKIVNSLTGLLSGQAPEFPLPPVDPSTTATSTEAPPPPSSSAYVPPNRQGIAPSADSAYPPPPGSSRGSGRGRGGRGRGNPGSGGFRKDNRGDGRRR